MNISAFKQFLIFLGLLVFEIFVVSRIQISYLISPSVYLFFILQLRVRTSGYWVLLFGFLSGLLFDLIFHTGGVHAASTTLAAFLRVLILPVFLSTEDYDNNIHPGIYTMGPGRFLLFSFILLYAHHLSWFMLEIFKFDRIWITLLKAVISSMLSLALIYIIGLLFYKKKRI